MHRSRLSTLVIDCKSTDVTEAATFWSRALGRELLPPEPGDDRYRTLKASAEPGEPVLLVQRVDHESRVHLDIEADDVEAEVKRLEALGARRLEKVRSFWVMEAPTGQRFCVVRPQRGPLDDGNASVW